MTLRVRAVSEGTARVQTLSVRVKGGARSSRAARWAARMLLAAINEAGLIIAQSPRPREARQEAGDAFDALLDGLRRTPGSDAAQPR